VGKVATGFSTSLDGFIASPNGDVGPLFDWYFAGDTEYAAPGGNFTLRVSAQSAELLSESYGRMGALVVGRRHFDHARGWGGRHPMGVPVFVVTHSVPRGWIYEGSAFTFVTAGVESAVEQAKEVAGSKDEPLCRRLQANRFQATAIQTPDACSLKPLLTSDSLFPQTALLFLVPAFGLSTFMTSVVTSAVVLGQFLGRSSRVASPTLLAASARWCS